jgi:hypothetical protein
MIVDHAYQVCTKCGKVDYHGNLEDRREEGYYHLLEIHHFRGIEVMMFISQEDPSECDNCFGEMIPEEESDGEA